MKNKLQSLRSSKLEQIKSPLISLFSEFMITRGKLGIFNLIISLIGLYLVSSMVNKIVFPATIEAYNSELFILVFQLC